MTHQEKIKTEIAQAKEQVCALVGIEPEDWEGYLFEMACLWLEEMESKYQIGTAYLLEKRAFWNWWKQKFSAADREFLEMVGFAFDCEDGELYTLFRHNETASMVLGKYTECSHKKLWTLWMLTHKEHLARHDLTEILDKV